MSIHHDPAKGERPFVLACSLFGGRSPRTDKPVGTRHRWLGGDRCQFCHMTRDQVMSTPTKERPT